MTELYPEIEPYDHGMLDVGDGNLMYWETCGNSHGKPAVVLHGGPGSGCSTGVRRFFDPSAYRIVLFDQRGCGRSMPHASDPRTDLSVNTTEHLLADIERLRQHLGIDRWLLFGGSWGSTLGLAYAERNPQRVTEIVLVGVPTTRRSEIDWLYRGVAPLFPAQWARFRAGAPAAERDGDLVEACSWSREEPTRCQAAAYACRIRRRSWCGARRRFNGITCTSSPCVHSQNRGGTRSAGACMRQPMREDQRPLAQECERNAPGPRRHARARVLNVWCEIGACYQSSNSAKASGCLPSRQFNQM